MNLENLIVLYAVPGLSNSFIWLRGKRRDYLEDLSATCPGRAGFLPSPFVTVPLSLLVCSLSLSSLFILSGGIPSRLVSREMTRDVIEPAAHAERRRPRLDQKIHTHTNTYAHLNTHTEKQQIRWTSAERFHFLHLTTWSLRVKCPDERYRIA